MLLRHGILRERLGDILTDALQAQILSILGYRTDMVQFVSAEHTDKNLLIRAIRLDHPTYERATQDYTLLRNLEPYLARLLRQELAEKGVDSKG